jgi:phosphate-selective porin OprO and OprP
MKFRRLPLVLVAIVASHPGPAMGEDLDAPDPEKISPSKAYQYDHEYFSIRFGGGLLIDYNRFDQDSESEDQLDWDPEIGIRDLRALASGRTPWPVLTYTVGYAYIAATNEFRFRQTGFKLKIDALSGFFFLGRTKEGFSTNKLMVGYYGWFNERSAANDAFIPILADGVRWNGTGFDGQLVYNVGAFADVLSKWESFNKNDWQFAARAVWLPFGGNAVDGVLHLALEGRFAGADDDQLQYRSKPEAFLAQVNAVDTGKFDADTSLMGGVEAYYVRGPLSAGTEYFVNQVSSGPAGDPFFHGGELFAAYMFTGETHPYNPETGVFTDVTPAETFFSGGPGAWELALRLSYVDLDSGPIEGGKFFRFTSLVNWYMTDALRLEGAYGYGVLDRFDQTGGTHFIQGRVQLQFK